MKVVINADDLGFTKGVTDGIIYGFKKGVISSTTALCNMKNIVYAAERVKECKGLGVGVHLTLTLGRPITEAKTLVDEDGKFFDKKEIFSKQINLDEVYIEFKAQIERFKEVFNRMPTHIDSHHSIHDNPIIMPISKRIADEYNLKMRRHNEEFKFVSGFYGEHATSEKLIELLKNNKNEKGIEIMVHPGYCDLELYNVSSYSVDRVKELSVLCNDYVKDFIRREEIILTTF